MFYAPYWYFVNHQIRKWMREHLVPNCLQLFSKVSTLEWAMHVLTAAELKALCSCCLVSESTKFIEIKLKQRCLLMCSTTSSVCFIHGCNHLTCAILNVHMCLVLADSCTLFAWLHLVLFTKWFFQSAFLARAKSIAVKERRFFSVSWSIEISLAKIGLKQISMLHRLYAA